MAIPTIKRIALLSMALFLSMLTALSGESAHQGQIGIVAPLSGDLSKNGLTARVAMEIARKDFQRVHPDTVLDLVIEDSASNPNRAAEIVQAFYQQGIRIVIAAVSSQELLAIKPFADAHGMIVITPTSTAPSLALEDSIIRLTPNDFLHAQSMAEYLASRGIQAVAPIYRNDVFGNDFISTFKARFEEKGGSVCEGVAYDPGTSDFSSYTNSLSAQIQSALQTHATSTVAVLDVSFGELYSLFTSASNHPNLSTVNWYGIGDFAKDARIDNDPSARSFALSVQFTSSVFSPHATVYPYTSIIPSYENLVTLALKIDSGVSETRLCVMYDSLWLAGLIVRNPPMIDVPTFLSGRPPYIGFSDFIALDRNGDRINEFYSYFRYVDIGGAPRWVLVGSYWPTNTHPDPAMSPKDFIHDSNDKRVRVGLLLPLTGNYASKGTSFARMIETAKSDINALLQRKYTRDSQIEFTVADTQSDPGVALAKIQEMKKQGIQWIIGPMTSAEVDRVADFANQNEMILISPSSTALSLAKDDNLFRLTLDDRRHAKALAAFLIHEGYRNVESLYRNDTYGSEFYSLFNQSFTEMGGHCGAGIPYDPALQQFDGVLKTLEIQVSESMQTYAAQQAAVLMISFDEGISILETVAITRSPLADLRWFGGDGIATNKNLLESPTAVEMAVRTRLTASIFGRGASIYEVSFVGSFLERIHQELGYVPTAFDVSAYDAAWLFTLLAENQNWQFNAPIAEVRSDFVSLANNTYGYRSMNMMNESGDCRYGNIDFYRIDSTPAKSEWNAFATYSFFLYSPEGLTFFRPSGDSRVSEWSLYR